MANEEPVAPPSRQLLLQKIYVKDLSFESPRAPAVFNSAPKPHTELGIKSSAQEIGPDTQEVTLTLTVQAREGDQTLFLVEIQQAGIFVIRGYSSQERDMLIGSFCPSTLYPFAREAIADLISKGGFPQLLLQPINFDALYAQAAKERAAAAAGATAEAHGGGGPH
jgi:preprotein translocase subunit SecB